MPADWINRERHPFDDGYWARYDGKPRPRGEEQRSGWDTCDRELKTGDIQKPKDERLYGEHTNALGGMCLY